MNLLLPVSNGHTRKIVYTMITVLLSMLSAVFVFGGKYRTSMDRINEIPCIQKKIQEYDNKMIKFDIACIEIKEIKSDVKDLVRMQMENRKSIRNLDNYKYFND